jgi:hypothetical protein
MTRRRPCSGKPLNKKYGVGEPRSRAHRICKVGPSHTIASPEETRGGKALEAALRGFKMEKEIEELKDQLAVVRASATDARLAGLLPNDATLRLWVEAAEVPSDRPEEADGPW